MGRPFLCPLEYYAVLPALDPLQYNEHLDIAGLWQALTACI
jgi:hypothetical protein